MTYNNIHKGIFLSRPNRFIAEIEINGKVETCHVKNTGRCKELLIPGTTAYVNAANNPSRTTKYDLVAVNKGDTLINIDSQAPNAAFSEYLQQGKFTDAGHITTIKSEARYNTSRFDFYVETATCNAFIEVKGVTLEYNGIAMFPDAPTQRGIKHLTELAACVKDGYNAFVVFVIQMKGVSQFMPNNTIHAAFGETLAKAVEMGVVVKAFDCIISPESMVIDAPITIKLKYMPLFAI